MGAIEEYNKKFEETKSLVNRDIGKGIIRPEREVRRVIYSLNRLSFLYTKYSCPGHLRATRKGFDFEGGYVGFVFKAGEASRQFISALENRISICDGAHIEYHTTTSKDKELDELFEHLSFNLNFGQNASLGLNLLEGLGRNRRRKAVIRELHELALQYLGQTQPI